MVAFVDDVEIPLSGGDDDDAGRRGEQLAVVIRGVAPEDAAMCHAFRGKVLLMNPVWERNLGERPHARQAVQFRAGRMVVATRQSYQENGYPCQEDFSVHLSAVFHVVASPFGSSTRRWRQEPASSPLPRASPWPSRRPNRRLCAGWPALPRVVSRPVGRYP